MDMNEQRALLQRRIFNFECRNFRPAGEGHRFNECRGLRFLDCELCPFAKTEEEFDAEQSASLQRRTTLGLPLSDFDKEWNKEYQTEAEANKAT
jgi:hypothetical protein